jgi:hypothetical protein
MARRLDYRLQTALVAAEGLVSLAQQLARIAAAQVPSGRARRNTTLRPGPATPMWNALVLAVAPHLRRRGTKINLGRELGLPPQRIHEFFVARTASPDAERTLAVLRWLATRPPKLAASSHASPKGNFT